ncbi:molybdopterin-dependent oxidoreductase [Rhodoferax ferrireducens]|uniref:molybdopterin-dependent oxidoreductase n=1 Tax=Rhodoferax ferrireducens TaxID=192843 RepID=UPI000E0D18B2|nr:molybdopterin-dependent oxidoreductase [Rhodoferax ferrireducens]
MMNAENKPLPPGQFEFPSFDRFGLGLFAKRFPANPDSIAFTIGGDVGQSIKVGKEFAALPRVEQMSDFHCVTTWSVLSVRWSGVRFSDFYQQVVVPLAKPQGGANFVVFRGEDGFSVSMPLDDLMASDVLLADSLDGHGLGIEHGAPLRLVAPAHYGYKNAKHISAIEFWCNPRNYRFPFPYPKLMDHPRGRVALEERARFLPLWLIRPLYRALMPLARYKMRKSLETYRAKGGRGA